MKQAETVRWEIWGLDQEGDSCRKREMGLKREGEVDGREGERGLSERPLIFRWPGCQAMTHSLRAVTEYHIGFTCQH